MEINSSERQNTLTCFFSVAFLLLCELFFFRNVILTDGLFGDSGDGRLTMLITEHWFHVFQGKAAIADLGIFYPAGNTLAYSDMLLGYGLVHSLLRFMGMDIFYAYKATLIFVHLLGTFSTFYLLKRSLRTDFTWAMFGTITFSFSNTYAIHYGHTQLVAISALPLVAIFVLAFFRNLLKSRPKRTLYAILTTLTLALVLYTSWYMAFFTALFMTIFFIITLCTAKKQKILAISKEFLKSLGIDIVFYILLVVALAVPFLLLSLPVLKMSGGWRHGFLIYGPEFLDIINVSTENWLLGSLIRKLRLDSRGYSFEVIEGFNIVLLLAFFVLAYRVYRLNAKRRVLRYSFYKIFVLSIIISILLVVRLSANGISLWFFVYYLFPGGKAIRAVARYFFFLSLPMAVITAMMGDSLFKAQKRSTWPTFILLALAFIANIHTEGVSTRWDRSSSLSFINSVALPPGDCKVFYIVNPKKGIPPWVTQLDAYQIADHFSISTINGYSGNVPSGWGNIWNVDGDSAEYEKAVSEWIISNKLENVYAYDKSNNVWRKFSEVARISTDISVLVFDKSMTRRYTQIKSR